MMMDRDNRVRPRCFVALPYSPRFQPVREAVRKGIEEAHFRATVLEESQPYIAGTITEALKGELARADCIVADISERNPNVYFEIGLAHAMEKGLFLLSQDRTSSALPYDLLSHQVLFYLPTPTGLRDLSTKLASALRDFRRAPRRARAPLGAARFPTPFFVEWDRLDPSEIENLCRELLAQMGYQQLDWDKEGREFDLIAELPRKDPDGFEYRELWIIAMGRNAPPDMLLQMALDDPDFVLHRLFRDSERFERLAARMAGDVPITLLVVLIHGDLPPDLSSRLRSQSGRRSKHGPFPFGLRVRVWDRSYLTSLIQQFPQIGYKYFSDEARSRSKFRKTPEQLYQENVDLTIHLTTLVTDLEDEKNKRVRAERDSVWKDISFSAAHKIGNPIFAIETNLDPLIRRIDENRRDEANSVIADIRTSVEKAKGIVDQFKSLTRAQEISPIPTLLRPILDDACRAAQNRGVTCDIVCPPSIQVYGDPDRLAECFDELASNATHWLSGAERVITVNVAILSRDQVPTSLDTSKQYALIHFKDNGPGVPLELKTKIFDAFFTTRDHGTGLGLAVVRRIVEGHGGTILESGRPEFGADFEIYLPLVSSADEADLEDMTGHSSSKKSRRRMTRKK
jgi:signal transduction histidine kinase